MILDIGQMDFDERRTYLVLAKDLLRQMSQESFISYKYMVLYESAYLAVSSAIRALDEQKLTSLTSDDLDSQ